MHNLRARSVATQQQKSPLEIRRYNLKGFTLFVFRINSDNAAMRSRMWKELDPQKILAHIRLVSPEFMQKTPEILKGDGVNCPLGVGQIVFR